MEQPIDDPVEPMEPAEPEGAPQPDRAARLRIRRQRGRRQAIEWVLLIGAALVIALVIKTFLFQAFYIPSESMVPTLKVHDRVLVNKLSYKLHPVHRSDIVVFTKPKGELSNIKDLVKRVVALPGETVEGRDGHVYVDGKRLDEPYLPPGITTQAFPARPIPSNAVWVMGDNRGQSEDSRVFGPILKSSIVGRVFVRIWPLTRLAFL
ncbi:MAG: signal peptidase [Actinomycetota bacterium]|nr:signal peptidase [Actinomycetota bacterium]